MKNGPFKMAGYNYPGTSPVKGKQPTDPTKLTKEEKESLRLLKQLEQKRLDESISSLGELPRSEITGLPKK